MGYERLWKVFAPKLSNRYFSVSFLTIDFYFVQMDNWPATGDYSPIKTHAMAGCSSWTSIHWKVSDDCPRAYSEAYCKNSNTQIKTQFSK